MAPVTMTPDGNGAMGPVNTSTAGTGAPNADVQGSAGIIKTGQKFTDAQLLEMWKRWKKESFDQRWIFERQWMRNIWYILNRQWIYFDSKRGQWQDKRLARWIPRPVTNVLKEGVQAVRANFAAVDYAASARPIGQDSKNIVTAGVADGYAPLLHEEHQMDFVMAEFDFWLLVLGNAYLHTAVDYDRKNGMSTVNYEDCQQCGVSSSEADIANAGQACPACKGKDFQPTMDPATGAPKQDQVEMPKGKTYAPSPFEVAFPLMYSLFDDAPYVIRMRWRDKSYYEQHEALQQYSRTLAFSKTPQERTMQIFKTLPFQGDIGITPPYFASGGANVDAEGIVEYDVWIKPCADFPEGQVIRIAGDAAPTVIHLEDQEDLPGPLPYHNSEGNPIFPWHHARYEHVGGRVMGSGLIDPAVQKQDQLNQLDSHMLMTIGRMANPIWLEPKGAEVEKFTGEPGLVVKWNPLVAGGNAKPERIPGEGINQSVFQYRELVKQECEELMGTFDVLKGERPSGVEAYAAMSFLLERGQARHASAFKERARAYKGWFSDALVIEQEFGPETRTRAVMGPNQGWAFNEFKKADLSGTVDIIIENGTPKNIVSERAAIDHLAQLGLIDPSDPDTKMAIYEKFGEESLMPGVDAQVKEAWMNMDKLEAFLADPAQVQAAAQAADLQAQIGTDPNAPPSQPIGPLVYRRWYNPQIHRNELVKWCLSDRGRKTFEDHPAALQLVDAYLSTIDLANAQAQMGIIDSAGVPINTNPGAGGPPAPPGNPNAQGPIGRAQQMRNSNQNAGGVGKHSSGGGSPASTAKSSMKQAQGAASGTGITG